MASAKPPEKVIPVTHAKPWLEEKLRHVELKLAAVEDFEKISIEEGFRERMLVLAKHHDEYTKQLETLNQEFSDLFRDYACLLYTSPSPRDVEESRMPSSA